MEAPAVLYHYTSLDTLAMILHNRTIRFSRFLDSHFHCNSLRTQRNALR